MNVLFVCTENIARSPMAEALFHELQGPEGRHRAHTVGTATHAPRPLTTREVACADLVAVMEDRHLELIRHYWPHQARKVVVLGVSDDFAPNDRHLRQTLEPRIRTLLERCDDRPAVASRPLAARPRRAKRVFDLLLSGVALVHSAPIWALVALLIKLDSRGPVFFTQARVGRGGRVFRIIKLRTMVDGAEAKREELLSQSVYGDARLFKMPSDPRMTRLGRWLRQTSLDELPQLLNVLKGDMSLVGPRPCIRYETENFAPHHFERFLVQPGMTGLWQVTARARSTFGEALDMDVAYARGWSLGLDLRLLCRTPLAVLRHATTA